MRHRPQSSVRNGLWLAASVVVAGCTQILGIDGTYTVETPLGGNGGVHGSAGAGDHRGIGGAADEGGATASGGVASEPDGQGDLCGTTGASCGATNKCCIVAVPEGGIIEACLPPTPLVGCAAVPCDTRDRALPCPFPVNSEPNCVNGACAFTCNPGFVENEGGCIPDGSSGAGGNTGGGGTSGGAGGKTTTCVAKNCPACSLAGPIGCCTSQGTCGCTWATSIACY